MLNENAKKWVEALRSGKFKQGKNFLHSIEGDTFCCLGVACELAVKEGIIPEPILKDTGTYVYGDENDSSNGFLPRAVKNWLGLGDVSGRLKMETGNTSLTNLNDSGTYDFNAIADIIEGRPEGLFESK